MKVLVTGSSGWLGRFIVPLLEQSGNEVVGLDLVAGEQTDILASVADLERLDEVFAQHTPDAVIHGAALHKPDIARHPAQAFIDTNVTGTLALLERTSRKPGAVFVYTSTTSVMISQRIRDAKGREAIWLDESAGPLEPRNIYSTTKLAAELLCRQHHLVHGLPVVVLRTSRFFPEEDDTIAGITGHNLKVNELLHRRATVQDMARAHVAAMEQAASVGFGLYLVSAPTPFGPEDMRRLKDDAESVVLNHYPQAVDLYKSHGWTLPTSLDRVYDGRKITQELGFRYETTYATALEDLSRGRPSPVIHDPTYVSPLIEAR